MSISVNKERLKALIATNESEKLFQQEILRAFQKVLEVVNQHKQMLGSSLAQMEQTYKNMLAKQEEGHQFSKTELENMFKTAGAESILKKIQDEHNALLKSGIKKIKNLKNGLDGKDGIGIKGDRGSPDTPNEVIRKINRAGDLIKPEAVEGLTELIKQSKEGRGRQGGRVLAGPRNLTEYYNATSQANGSTRTFTGPIARYVPMIFLRGQTPITLLAGVDFTASGRSLILDNSIEPPATGTGVYIQYQK